MPACLDRTGHETVTDSGRTCYGTRRNRRRTRRRRRNLGPPSLSHPFCLLSRLMSSLPPLFPSFLATHAGSCLHLYLKSSSSFLTLSSHYTLPFILHTFQFSSPCLCVPASHICVACCTCSSSNSRQTFLKTCWHEAGKLLGLLGQCYSPTLDSVLPMCHGCNKTRTHGI